MGTPTLNTAAPCRCGAFTKTPMCVRSFRRALASGATSNFGKAVAA
jgi:hypothetical protein